MVDGTAPETPIVLYRYDSIDFGFIYPMDLTGFDAMLKFRSDEATFTPFSLTPSSGLTVTPGAESEITMQLTTAQWDALAALPEGARYDLEISLGAYRKTFFRGTLVVVHDL